MGARFHIAHAHVSCEPWPCGAACDLFLKRPEELIDRFRLVDELQFLPCQ